MNTNPNSNYNVIIGGQTYQLTVWLWNQLENYPPIMVSPFFIDSICIEETLNNWWITGWLILNNDLEVFERGNLYERNLTELVNLGLNTTLLAAAPGTATTNIQTSLPGTKSPYLFRTDGRNRLSISFYPVKVDDTSGDFPRSSWELNYDCVICDLEDLPTDNIKKRKKIYFHSEVYQYCLENNVEFSTANFSGRRTLPANLALSSLLQTAANFQTTKVNVGYSAKSTINNPDIPFDAGTTDPLDWDPGPEESNRVFYTSPANSNIVADIDYLLPQLEAAAGGPVILSYGRLDDNKKWSLKPLSQYFAEAQQSQVERIMLADSMDQTAIYVPRAPLDAFGQTTNNIQNFMSGFASVIHSYQYVPMVSIDDMRLTNRPLHTYDFASGSFRIQINTAKSAQTTLYNCGKSGLYSFKQKKGQLSRHFNQTKATGRMVTNEFVPVNNYNPNMPRNQMVLDSIFLGNSLYFQTNGLTIRSPGKFLFVDRLAATVSNANHPFDDKFLGQWMMIKVAHYINPSQNTYINDVIATKIDNFIKLWPEEDPKF